MSNTNLSVMQKSKMQPKPGCLTAAFSHHIVYTFEEPTNLEEITLLRLSTWMGKAATALTLWVAKSTLEWL
jgi:hypothetical protein